MSVFTFEWFDPVSKTGSFFTWNNECIRRSGALNIKFVKNDKWANGTKRAATAAAPFGSPRAKDAPAPAPPQASVLMQRLSYLTETVLSNKRAMALYTCVDKGYEK